ncbi:MAG: hypothetical protein OXU69_10530 [Gemmatimonadota bacterium]|nr:hypothetical protein [Gemmatimonadota bacterium]MDE2985131.1 hypothetical protein [Gemmatimonadota bacterium]
MKSPVTRCFGLGAVLCCSMLATLTAGCETEPETALSVTGTWTGLEVPDSSVQWELALVDLPPDSIWGSARYQDPESPGWSRAQQLTGWRDGTSVVLQWGPMGSSFALKYEADVGLVEEAPQFMTGSLFWGHDRQSFARLSMEKTR